MKRLLFCITLFIVSCNQKSPSTEKNTQQPEFSYTDNAVKILENGSILSSSEEINEYYSQNPPQIEVFDSVFSIKANRDYWYEIATFKSEGQSYKQLIITLDSAREKRNFEFIAKADEVTLDIISTINARRKEWIELCNQHNARELVTKLYSKEPIYYNHKPVITNVDSLVKEYSYMNNPKYALNLSPKHIEIVNSQLIFEIGQCSGSYGGKYILIWEKDENEEWRIKIDSNI